MTLAIASPLNRSRMMPTAITRLAPAKKPADARPNSMRGKLCATAQPMVDTMNSASALPITGLRPNRSDKIPNSSDPTPNPRKQTLIISCRSLAFAIPRSWPMAGSAGNIGSVDRAFIAIRQALSTTNSRKPMSFFGCPIATGGEGLVMARLWDQSGCYASPRSRALPH